MERFEIVVNGFKPLTIITKRSILDVAVALDPPLILVLDVKSTQTTFSLMILVVKPWQNCNTSYVTIFSMFIKTLYSYRNFVTFQDAEM